MRRRAGSVDVARMRRDSVVIESPTALPLAGKPAKDDEHDSRRC